MSWSKPHGGKARSRMSVWTWEVILTTKFEWRMIAWQYITLFTLRFDHLGISKYFWKLISEDVGAEKYTELHGI